MTETTTGKKPAGGTRVRDQRLEIRCYADEKNLLRQAAALDNRTLSNWLLHVALREARKLVDADGEKAAGALDDPTQMPPGY